MGTWYLLIGHYGYIAAFIILSLGVIGIGLPVPDEIVLTYLGYVTSLGEMSFLLLLVSAFFGSLCGISVSYLLGIKLGEPFLKKYGPKFFIKEKTILKTNQLFHKYGSLMLIISYFIPGVRHVAAYLAGITRFSFKRFALFAYIGSFVWVIIFLGIGYHLGENWEHIFFYIHKYMWSLILSLLVLTIILIFYKSYSNKRRI